MPLARGIGSALTAIDPGLTYGIRPLAESVSMATGEERLVALVSGFFGGLALLLAAVGLHGLAAYAVSRRRREIGVRIMLGAAPAHVVWLMLSKVLVLVGVGVVIGATASAWLSRFVAPLLYGLEPRDPVALATAVITLAVVGTLAAWMAAVSAARIDPAVTLRE
jgi:putative ABC transport system permease protein